MPLKTSSLSSTPSSSLSSSWGSVPSACSSELGIPSPSESVGVEVVCGEVVAITVVELGTVAGFIVEVTSAVVEVGMEVVVCGVVVVPTVVELGTVVTSTVVLIAVVDVAIVVVNSTVVVLGSTVVVVGTVVVVANELVDVVVAG